MIPPELQVIIDGDAEYGLVDEHTYVTDKGDSVIYDLTLNGMTVRFHVSYEMMSHFISQVYLMGSKLEVAYGEMAKRQSSVVPEALVQ
jgi:hypothetical protein